MTSQYIQTTATINEDINFLFPFSFGKVEETGLPKLFRQNAGTWSELGSTAEIRIGIIDSSVGEKENPMIPEPSGENASASHKLNFDEEIEFGIAQKFADVQQLPDFPFYNEEDILNLDAVIFTPPPLESGTIRVKLIYEEPSKPIPVEDPWEE